MQNDPFGNLEQWSAVLARIDALEAAHGLDDVQPALVRLIRYRDNWQLRERALRAARELRQPQPAVLATLCNVAADSDTYADARILAIRALEDLTPRVAGGAVPGDIDAEFVINLLQQQLEIPEAPIVHQAMRRALNRLNSALQPR